MTVAVAVRRFAARLSSRFLALAACLAVLMAPHAVRAAGGQTGNLTGTVADAVTKQPVAGAVVSAVAPTGTYRTTTDARGFFSIVGVTVDTYLVSVQAQGYDGYSIAGVTVTGDQTVALGSLVLQKRLRTIGRVTARSPSSVFQPNQTIDSYTVTGERIIETTGKAASTNENDLVLSVPGVTLTNSNSITIRGGLQTEVGYQFDGIDFTEPFFSQNASNGRFNGLGSLQIVEGAGDATQGNVGGGVVNLIPKRGTNPPFGFVDFEAGAPNFFHQFSFEYGAASPNGRFSNYIAYNGQRDVPYSQQPASGYPGTATAAYDNYYGTSYESNDDLIDNFIFKFGKNNAQSLQVLYLNRNLVQYGNLGGIIPSGPNRTLFYVTDPFNPLRQYLGQAIGPIAEASYPKLVGLTPNTPSDGIPTGPEESAFNPTRYLKFEYDNNLNSTTFARLRYYNWETQQGTGENIFSSSAQPLSLGLGTYPLTDVTGGPRVGTTLDLTKQIGASSTTTLSLKYEDAHPVWNDYDPDSTAYLLSLNLSRMHDGPSYLDFLPNGYLQQFFPNGVPRIPLGGINYNATWFQTFGIGLREQYAPSDRLHFDLGVRVDGQNQHYGPNPLNPSEPNNPYDVNPVWIGRYYLNPREVEPRAAVSFQADKSDALRASYGRSVVFNNGQIGGTPSALYSFAPFLKVPAKDPSTFTCGSGYNPTYQVQCTNYAQQLYWLYDQNFDAPDVGDSLPALYSNYDFSWSHQFRNGLAMKLTPFYKLGVNLPSFALVRTLVPGQTVFTTNNNGINRTTGAEFGLNTAERAVGFTGFLSATYQNVLASTPPLIGGEDSLPVNSSGSLDLGDVYRAGYVSPFSVRFGGDYKTKSGFRINPVLQYDRGYPYGVGNTIASAALINGNFLNIPQVNFGPGVTQIPGIQGNTGSSSSTNYYDPAYPGSATHPNIELTRGTPETASAGGVLWKPNLSADLTFEYTAAKNTFGVQFVNLFGNAYNGAIPTINPYYQPVATGVAGPQTGVNPFLNPARGFANVPKSAYAFSNGAYLLYPVQPTTFLIYYQREL